MSSSLSGGSADGHAGKVETLVVGDPTLLDNLGHDVTPVGAEHPEPDVPVVDQDRVARPHVVGQGGVTGRGPLGCSVARLGRQDEPVPGAEHRAAVDEARRPRSRVRPRRPARRSGAPTPFRRRGPTRTRCRCSSCVPWARFTRATSMPASPSSRTRSAVEVAGPSVATMLARRRRRSARGDPESPDSIPATPTPSAANANSQASGRNVDR